MPLFINQSLGSDTVRRWTDQTANAFFLENLIKSQQPAYDSANGLVVFDGVESFLPGTLSGFTNNTFYVEVRAKLNQTSGVHVVWGFHDDDPDNAYKYLELSFIDSKATLQYGDGSAYNMIQEAGASDHSSVNIYGVDCDGSTIKLLKNNVTLDSSDVVYDVALPDLLVGKYGNVSCSDLLIYSESKVSTTH